MPLFSIIVPVFNSASCLDKCIQSLLGQSFQDFELLLIDDGSADESLSVCLGWAERDSRIRVFHQDNRGASAARNVGLQNACGSYIQFVDSDDTLTEDCLEKIAGLLHEYREPDFIEFRLHYYGPSGIHNVQGVTLQDGLYDRGFITGTFLPVMLQIRPDDALHYNIFNVLRVIKRELLVQHGIRFDESIRRWEDWLFALQVFGKARNMAVTQLALYNYFGHENGGLGGRYNPDTYKYLIATYQAIDRLFGDQYDTFSEYSIACRMAQFERCIREIFASEPAKDRKRIINQLLKNPYFVRLMNASSQTKGIFVLRPFMALRSAEYAYHVLSMYIHLSALRQGARRSISRLYHSIVKE